MIPVTRDGSGQLALNGKGEAVEWVLRMHRFPAQNELSNIAERGEFSDDLAQRLGASTARYHAVADKRTAHDGAKLIGDILEELNSAFAEMSEVLGAKRIGTFRADAAQAFAVCKPLLRTRAKAGQVRRCHGDLHLRNIVLIDGIPTPFDALEFDETLGTCDVLYDIAFLIMDLRHRGLDRAANLTLNAYLFHANDPDLETGLALMPLFLSIRAAIRAMVAVQTAQLGIADADGAKDARRYLDDAVHYLAATPVWLVALGGMSGTGKSTLAARLAPSLGAAPGAVHLRSDLERKALFDVDPLTRLPPSGYAPEVSADVYTRLAEKAARLLAAGRSVILDAAHLTEAERAQPEALATQAGADFVGLWLTADPKTLRNRVATRRNDASDADVSVVNQQISQSPGKISWAHLDASVDIDRCQAAATSLLVAIGAIPRPDHDFRGAGTLRHHERQ